MNTNIPSFIAGIIIVFSVFFGTHIQDTKTANNSDFLSSKNQPVNSNANASFLQDKLADIISLFQSSPIPKIPKIPAAKLTMAKDIPAPNLKIKAGIAIGENGKVFFEKNTHQKLPVASITKLITSLVALDELDPNEVIIISDSAVSTYGEMGNLVKGEKLTVNDLLYIMLIDSSNDAAVALAEAAQNKGKNFISLMNQKAKELQLIDSSFNDPSGLDPRNVSSAYDLAVLMNKCLMTPQIEKILRTEQIDVSSIDKKTIHHLKNTNKLLDGDSIIGGKTGYTEEAGECLVLAVKLKNENKYFISVVLGTEIGMRFIEMEKLVKWTKKVYGWQ